MAGLPDAELPDQSWMNPETAKKPPVSIYNEYNPRPTLPPVEHDEAVEYLRKIYRFLIGAAVGGVVGFVIYVLLVHWS